MRWPWRRKQLTDEQIRKQLWAHTEQLVGHVRFMLMDAPNYVEAQFRCPTTGDEFIVRIQRKNGFTPNQLRKVAEAERATMRDELDRVCEERDALKRALRPFATAAGGSVELPETDWDRAEETFVRLYPKEST